MYNIVSVTADVAGKPLTLECGLLGAQAAGAVTARMGDTILFSAVTCTDKPREGIDYFPLQVEYREKFYAAGRFPGGFFKREARPAEKEILTSRLTDRPIRPLFPEGYRNDVQINNMLLSADGQNDSDILSIVASSASLHVSEIPFMGPIAGVRVIRVDGNFIINPTNAERENNDLDLIYCSNRDLPLMIEGAAQEVDEADLVAAMRLAHVECVKIIDAQLELRTKLGLGEKVIEIPEGDKTLYNAALELLGSELVEALQTPVKKERSQRVHDVFDGLKEKLAGQFEEMTGEEFRSVSDELEIAAVRDLALKDGKRVDGRGFNDVRELDTMVHVLPRPHGSAIFKRGETQALGIVTLGTKSDKQSMDAVTGGATEKRFMLHYNFPPYSVGECGRLGFTGRREIGHGALAERSLRPVIPIDEFPYTIRMVSDIMSCNGSSSMASICVGTLAMMDAGVPLTAPVAGIAVGLFSDENNDKLVTDMIGTEDHCGDMDFKVAGTRNGVTGFQVDLKIHGLKWELVEGAFAQAKEARLKILDNMEATMPAPRTEMSEFAPRIETITIPQDKIGELIGPGGKNIRRITELSGAQIDIEEDGSINIFAVDSESMSVARREVEMVTAEVEEGKLYEGIVTGVKEFGAFVEVLPGKDGLVHISEMADRRIEQVEDVCKLGDQMWVKCIGIDDRGRVRLSRREAMRDLDEQKQAEQTQEVQTQEVQTQED